MPKLTLPEILRLLGQEICCLTGAWPSHLEIHCRGGEPIKLVFPPPFATVPAPPSDTSTDLASQILQVLAEAERPLKGRAIATRAGRPYSGHFREKLSDLKESGQITLTDDGYALSDADS